LPIKIICKGRPADNPMFLKGDLLPPFSLFFLLYISLNKVEPIGQLLSIFRNGPKRDWQIREIFTN